jgi:hypothetical protein
MPVYFEKSKYNVADPPPMKRMKVIRKKIAKRMKRRVRLPEVDSVLDMSMGQKINVEG